MSDCKLSAPVLAMNAFQTWIVFVLKAFLL